MANQNYDFGDIFAGRAPGNSFVESGGGWVPDRPNPINSAAIAAAGPSAGLLARPRTKSPAPIMPEIGELMTALKYAQANTRGTGMPESYANLLNDIRNSGFAAAGTGAKAYASRVAQSGFNPISSGVVEAQLKMPVYGKMSEVTAEGEKAGVEQRQFAAAQAAQIAQAIAAIRASYSKTLADFNANESQFDLDLSKFNAGQALELNKSTQQQRQFDAQLAAAMASLTKPKASAQPAQQLPDFDSGDDYMGYIPNSGPIIPGRRNGVVQPNQILLGGF